MSSLAEESRHNKFRPAASFRKPRRTLKYVYIVAVAILALLFTSTVYILSIRQQDGNSATEEGLLSQKDGALSVDMLLKQRPTQAFCERCSTRGVPLVCAHGGVTLRYPSNTMEAFQDALQLGVKCVEVDVSRSADGHLVALHARELASLLGQSYDSQSPTLIGTLPLHELQGLRWPSGESIAMAADVLRLLMHHVDTIVLDIKTSVREHVVDDSRSMAAATLELIHVTQCFVCLPWAKDDSIIYEIIERAPEQVVGYVAMNNSIAAHTEGKDDALRIEDAQVIAMHHEMVSSHLLSRLWLEDKIVFGWTANTATMISHVVDNGVDAIVTSFPDVVQQIVDTRSARC